MRQKRIDDETRKKIRQHGKHAPGIIKSTKGISVATQELIEAVKPPFTGEERKFLATMTQTERESYYREIAVVLGVNFDEQVERAIVSEVQGYLRFRGKEGRG